jgi:peptidoglycan/LPS O-acetylase OafA/YrhL
MSTHRPSITTGGTPSTPRSSITQGFIRELDGLRGLAILLVMVHRFWPRTGQGLAADVAGAGWIGVDLFFVISGFLIAGILLETRGEDGYFRNFYARRALRIFPLYYLFVIGVFVVFSGNPAFREDAGSPLWYLLHLGNIPEGVLGNEVPYWLGPVWSLAIEEQFYLTFPWLVYFLDRRRLTGVLIAMIALAPAIRAATMLAAPDHERVQYLFTPCRIDTIAIGCLLAVAARTIDLARWRERVIVLAYITIPGAVMLGLMSGLARTSPFDRVFGYSIVAIGCASVVALVVLARGQGTTAVLRWPPLTYLGKLCFGLYLLHRPADTFVTTAAAQLGIDRQLWLLPVKLAVAVVLATISWRVLEQPLLALKDRFASTRHPGAAELVVARSPTLVTRVLRLLGIAFVVVGLSCRARTPDPIQDDAAHPGDSRGEDVANPDLDPPADGPPDTPFDAPADVLVDAAAADAPADAPAAAPGVVLYPEGPRHSPITPAIVVRLQAIATTQAHDRRVFAKIGDSITVAPQFLRCFAIGPVELGSHGHLAPTLAYFLAGDAAGTTPFARASLAAKGGTTALDAMTGTPCPVDAELAAIDPAIAVVMFGTNEIRYDWTFDAAASHLWALVDHAIARGVVPILSTIPANPSYPAADARIPTFNRLVRAIAQGRAVPLIDLHRELAPLPNRGISSDNLHPSWAPGGACLLDAAGLQHGYNVRNLLTLEALARTNAALDGVAVNATAPTRAGAGTMADPFVGALPLIDLGDTRAGELAVTDHGCGGPATAGHEIVYRVQLSAATTLDAHVVDRAGVDVDVRILAGGGCVASGDAKASATVGPGTVEIVVGARAPASDGEFLVVIEPR